MPSSGESLLTVTSSSCSTTYATIASGSGGDDERQRAVDGDGGAGDVVGGGGEQERHESGDFLGRSGAAPGNIRFALAAIARVLDRALVHRREDHPRGHAVDGDPLRSQFER